MCHTPPLWQETFVTGTLGVFGTVWHQFGTNLEKISKSTLFKASPQKFPTQCNFWNENLTNGVRAITRDGRMHARKHKKNLSQNEGP